MRIGQTTERMRLSFFRQKKGSEALEAWWTARLDAEVARLEKELPFVVPLFDVAKCYDMMPPKFPYERLRQ